MTLKISRSQVSTQPNPPKIKKKTLTQPNPTHGWTQPMTNSASHIIYHFIPHISYKRHTHDLNQSNENCSRAYETGNATRIATPSAPPKPSTTDRLVLLCLYLTGDHSLQGRRGPPQGWSFGITGAIFSQVGRSSSCHPGQRRQSAVEYWNFFGLLLIKKIIPGLIDSV